MATLKEIRARIGSVKNTRKITSAMSRIASARLARAQNAMMAARPFAERMSTMVSQIVGELGDEQGHELLLQRGVERVGIIVVTADRGLCGGFNTNATRVAQDLIEQEKAAGHEVVISCVGRKGAVSLGHAGHEIFDKYPAPDPKTSLEIAERVAADAVEAFSFHDEGVEGLRVDRVVIVYNHFINVLTQDVRAVQLLPVPAEGAEEGLGERKVEPSMEQLLSHLLPISVETSVQTAMLNSAAAELAAKRVAMDAATDNASELVDELTLEYNRGRQAAITTELIEIVSGAQAV